MSSDASAPKLAGLPMLAAFTFVLLSLLALVFPTGREYAAFTSETRPDAYSIAYLDVLTRANPKELDLRMVYARQLATLGKYEEAIAAATPVTHDDALGPDAKQLVLDVSLARARAIPESDPHRRVLEDEAHAMLRTLVTIRRSTPRTEELAELALALGDPALAVVFYDDLAAREPMTRGKSLANAGRWLLASGDPKGASDRYHGAHDAATITAPSDAVGYAVLAIESLEASGDPRPAAELADRFVGRYPREPRILSRAARLATACGHAASARVSGRLLLTLRPDDEAVIRDQVQRELAAGDSKSALDLLGRLVARHPNEYALRLQRARVAEWAGDLDTAEKDLLWLVAHRADAPRAGP